MMMKKNIMQFKPRGKDRLMYFADGGINAFNLWDPFTEEQLRGYINDFADNGIDIFAQLVYGGGGTKPGLFVPEHPDFPWWPNERFRKLIDSGVQPLEIMIAQAHRRKMKFFCKMRMSDWHKRTVEESGFIGRHPEFQNPTTACRPSLDYTHRAVRDYHAALIAEMARRFDIDGLTLNFIRGWYNFPKEVMRARHPLMTEFLRQVRAILDQWSRTKGKKMEIGVIVPPTIELCAALGHDLSTWINVNLIDYVSPANGGYSDPNADHNEWIKLCRKSNCRYFPMLQCQVAVGDNVNLLKPEQIRAIAKGMYAGGADGIGVFNWVYYWSRRGGAARYAGGISGYPLALAYLRELREPAMLAKEPCHYLFRPLGMKWAIDRGFYEDDYRIKFKRVVGAKGEYLFRLPEDINKSGGAQIFIYIIGLTVLPEEGREPVAKYGLSTNAPGLLSAWRDEIEIAINGEVIPSGNLRKVFHPEGRLEKFGRPLPPYTSFWFDLKSPPVKWGENILSVELLKTDEQGGDEIIIEELEIVVMPRPLK